MTPEQFSKMADRLRWPPMTGTIPGSLPIMFFGALPKATLATIGINPSRTAYLSATGIELAGAKRRFETHSSLGVAKRDAILCSHADQAISAMREYFASSMRIHPWFKPLANVLKGFGASYMTSEAAHLDLVQEATDPMWSMLNAANPIAAKALLDRDLPFLKWEIEAFALRTLICTSATVQRHVLRLMNAQILNEGMMGKVKWTVAIGHAGEREVEIVGWNVPLARATGLTNEDHLHLGTVLRRELDAFPR